MWEPQTDPAPRLPAHHFHRRAWRQWDALTNSRAKQISQSATVDTKRIILFSRSAADKAAVRGHLLISHARGFIFIFYGALAWRHLLSFGERGLFGPPLTLRRPRRRSTVYSYADKLKVPAHHSKFTYHVKHDRVKRCRHRLSLLLPLNPSPPPRFRAPVCCPKILAARSAPLIHYHTLYFYGDGISSLVHHHHNHFAAFWPCLCLSAPPKRHSGARTIEKVQRYI
nr:uncharacterized protein LOC118878171 [Drosophila suzukii]